MDVDRITRNGVVVLGAIAALLLTDCDSEATAPTTGAAVQAHAPTAGTRHVALLGASNVRDISGYETTDGRRVSWGKVYRGDSLSSLTDEDVNKFSTLGIRTVVDFRSDAELNQDGPDRLPADAENIRMPMLDDSTRTISDAFTAAFSAGDPSLLEPLLGDGKAQEISEHAFEKMLDDPVSMTAVGDTIRLIADDEDRSVLYHCTGGKDRTGVATAIWLGVLGVPDETIVDDFVLSNDFIRAKNDARYERLTEHGFDLALVTPFIEQRPVQILLMLDRVQKDFAGWDEFANTVLRLDSATMGKLRDHLTA